VTRTLLLSLAASSLFLLSALYPFAGCGTSNSEAPDAADEGLFIPDVIEEGPDLCDFDAFKAAGKNGGACSPIAPDKPCFILCEASTGCACVAGPTGTGIWQCQEGDPCMPKCAPEDPDCGLDGSGFFDTGPLPESSIDASDDGPSDASGDGPTDAASDAPKDAGDAANDGAPKDSSGG
jgi:hypothetical protein